MSKYGHKQINRGDLVVSNPLLRCISDGASLFFPACDGSETIADSQEVFKSGVDTDFRGWNLSRPSKATRKTPAKAYRLMENATIKEMFTFLSQVDLNVLCVTEHQIKAFCKKHHDWLCAEGYGTLFLTKKNWKAPATLDNLFVAHVFVISGGLYVYAIRFEYGSVWYADGRRRLVVPKLVA